MTESPLRLGAAGAFTALALCLATPAYSEPPVTWSDSYVGRLEALAVMERLNVTLLAGHSATSTLEAWCAEHHIADPARVTAIRIKGVDKAITAEQRGRLRIGPEEPVRYRRVRLACGAHVLSEADNWYVPSRLTPEMNRLLDTTDIPFGRVVMPLRPERQTLSVEQLWSPLPPGWERDAPPARLGSPGRLAIPDFLFRHRALVINEQRLPIAEVAETYTGETLSFARVPSQVGSSGSAQAGGR